MATKQKMRPVASSSRRHRAVREESESTQFDLRLGLNRKKVRAWIDSVAPQRREESMDYETDAYRGPKKRKARDQEVIVLDSDSDEEEAPRHSSKKAKKTPNSAPPLRKRNTSYGRKRDEDVAESVPVRPFRNYIVISDDDDNYGAPVTPTPAQRTATRASGSGSVRDVGDQDRAKYQAILSLHRQNALGQTSLLGAAQRHNDRQAHPSSSQRQSAASHPPRPSQQATQAEDPPHSQPLVPEWLLQQPIDLDDQGNTQNELPVARRLFQQPARHTQAAIHPPAQQAHPGSQHQPVQHAQPVTQRDKYKGPRNTNQTQLFPFRPAQNGPQHPLQQNVQQVIEQVVQQHQYVDVFQQDDQKKALEEELKKTVQSFLQRSQVQSSPLARDQLGAQAVLTRTGSHSPSAAQTQLAARPKPRATPKKKSQSTSSSLPADYFCSMPTEVRENIFRHLLISNKPIQVSGIWTDLARAIKRRTGRDRRSRDEEDEDTTTTIDARILSVCRQTHAEGSRILYSENTFHYRLRDGDSVPSYALTPSSPFGRRNTAAARIQDWHTTWLASNKTGPINFKRYGPLLRRLHVELEPNRSTDEKYENLLICALEALISRPGVPISLHVLSLSFSPTFTPTTPGGPHGLSTAYFFAPAHRVMRALQQITTNYLHLNIHVDLAGTVVTHPPTALLPQQPIDPEDSDFDADAHRTRHLETTIDMRFTPRHMAAVPPSDAVAADLWARDALMPGKREARGRRAETCLAQLRRRIEGACADPDAAVRRNWFDDVEDAEYLRMRSVTGWVGTCEVEDADEVEDRVLVVRFGRDGAGRVRVVVEGV